jgi:hypothetical protein
VTSALAVGAHSIVATYAGDANELGSTSSPSTQEVDRAASAMSLSAAPGSPSTFGQSVTFTAQVAASPPGAGTPTGTVAFAVDGVAVDSESLVGGEASTTTASLSAGTHTITATYGGDGNFTGASSTLSYGVSCAVTITGSHSGAVIVNTTTCLSPGASVDGPVIVDAGGSLDIEGASVEGSIDASGGSGEIRVCDTQTTGAVSVSHAGGLVMIGDPGIGCAANRISGALVLNGNANGVEAIDNIVGGAVDASGNSGPGPYPGEETTITGNHT